MRASASDYPAVVRVLLHARAVVDAADAGEMTALMKACRSGASRDVVKQLLDAGADVNSVDVNNDTPLHFAARGGYVELVQLLIERGARIGAENKNRHNSAHEAFLNKQFAVEKLLWRS